ncbi:MAG: ATP-binding cassette domain-containing protein [Clostridia bacterium]
MISVQALNKAFGTTKAVDQVSFSIETGETYGLVGESGSGKSTIGNMICGLLTPTAGQVTFNGEPLWQKDSYRRPKPGSLQVVFQDPQSSLDIRMNIRQIITEPLRALPREERLRKSADDYLHALVRRVGMHEDHLTRYPHEFSGGQRQRIAIARAIITEPAFLILDEPTSALDISIQAQILNLLKSLQQERGLTYLFISHDMSVIRYMCDRVGVLYHGQLVEENETEALFTSPQQAYTQRLLSSLPKMNRG